MRISYNKLWKMLMFVPKGNGAIKVYEQKNAIQKTLLLEITISAEIILNLK